MQTCAYEFFGGIQWHDLTPNGKGEGVLLSLLFLIFDIILYGVIAVYLDNVIPSKEMTILTFIGSTIISITYF